ncbi:tRNA glutamyl-Q(34) synthetase GluQRS [Chitinibacter fontanus]|uniref:Glutamyl-Q tRNA(Asp) synthetase n=1 Tax=Chitinibacter fontanus TaxID=1737446 RepID=A0A7D5ZFE2_9NEIS|nr:tRNA glutamyl-Q(34) synthetase GluQRS [Chitinibacter fontanus]QLI82905.1 tRNA glutamyl-Q(34) synthetase GluQRS [Chitinibacter fontanus]
MLGTLSARTPYIGRFAPSPTGLLHMGSLMAAVASYLEAKRNAGVWLLRVEDLDPPREFPGATQSFLDTLERFGFCWDGPVVYQSQRHERYLEILQTLQEAGWVYPCSCTRKTLREDGLVGVDGLRYGGRCRGAGHVDGTGLAQRVKVPDQLYAFVDQVQGRQQQNLAAMVGDFVLRRADLLWAYQLAVVVDDADCGVTHIVRGADLLDSTPRQLFLQEILGFSHPQYLHIPVITNLQGEKLSKQTMAPALQSGVEAEQLWQALSLLWQSPPPRLRFVALADVWEWAYQHWDPARIPQKRSVAVTFDDDFEYKFQQ